MILHTANSFHYISTVNLPKVSCSSVHMNILIALLGALVAVTVNATSITGEDNTSIHQIERRTEAHELSSERLGKRGFFSCLTGISPQDYKQEAQELFDDLKSIVPEGKFDQHLYKQKVKGLSDRCDEFKKMKLGYTRDSSITSLQRVAQQFVELFLDLAFHTERKHTLGLVSEGIKDVYLRALVEGFSLISFFSNDGKIPYDFLGWRENRDDVKDRLDDLEDRLAVYEREYWMGAESAHVAIERTRAIYRQIDIRLG